MTYRTRDAYPGIVACFGCTLALGAAFGGCAMAIMGAM